MKDSRERFFGLSRYTIYLFACDARAACAYLHVFSMQTGRFYECSLCVLFALNGPITIVSGGLFLMWSWVGYTPRVRYIR